MKVKIYPTGKEASVGDERYEVEWQELTLGAKRRYETDPNYEHDRDRDEVSVVKHFGSLVLDRQFAKRKAASGRTVYGVATIALQRVELIEDWQPAHTVAEWAQVGDLEYFP
jgi:hypothetical protein